MKLRAKQRIDFYLGGAAIFLLRPIVRGLGHLLRRDHTLRVGREITILKLMGGGSLLLAYPALVGLRERHPDARLALVCSPEVAVFARTFRVFDEIRVIDDGSPATLLASGISALRRTFRSDTVLDLEVHSRLSTIFSVATCARNRLGFFLHDTFWRRGLHTHLIFFNRFSGSYYFYEKAIALLDATPAGAAACDARIRVGLPAPRAAEADGRERICVGVACSELAPERMLSPEQWERVFRERAGGGARRFVFLGAARDRELAEAVIRRAQAALPEHAYENLCGECSLPESLAELASADGYWGVDSGLLHYARLFRLKCLSYWGPTDPRTRLKPFDGLEEEAVYRKIPCSPCVHLAETAPCGGDNVCIQNLFETSGEGERWSPYVDSR